ncbi:hypothetical protein [Calidifontibacillus erzurumensis]|uniref:hypothetical protein n=1 Tax=Calidifontibacillus erzurumensis TaxID=2741433 RepID=UPI0035B563B6
MDVHIFGIIFIIILLPILYKVPIGLNKKEKLLIAGMTFILAEIGFLANKFLGLWKAIIILLLLTLIAAYIFETRLRSRFAGGGVSSKSSGRGQIVDLSNDEKIVEKLEENIHKDFRDFNLGQEAIDRLLFEREQSKKKNSDSIVLEEMQDQNIPPEHVEIPNEKSLAAQLNSIEEPNGIIEDSFNNAEQFSDFAQVQQLDAKEQHGFEREAIAVKENEEVVLQLETEHQDEKLQEQVVALNVEIEEESKQFDELEKAENISMEQLQQEEEQNQEVNEVVADSTTDFEADRSEDQSAQLAFEQKQEVDLEDLLSGIRVENDRGQQQSTQAPVGEDADSVDELLRRRNALFEELEESTFEKPAFISEEIQTEQSVEDVQENVEESEVEVAAENVEEETATVKEDIAREAKEDIQEAVAEAVQENVEPTVIETVEEAAAVAEDIVDEVKEDIAEALAEDVKENVEEAGVEVALENVEEETATVKEDIVEEAKEDIQETVPEETIEATVVENVLENVLEADQKESEPAREPLIEENESVLEPAIEFVEQEVSAESELDFSAQLEALEIIGENATEDEENQVNEMKKLDVFENISSSEMNDSDVKIGEESFIFADEIIENQGFELPETKTQQQMLNAMVENLHLSKQTLSPDEYANLVRSYMQPDLPDQYYFTFAFLLIEHFISQQEFNKLSDLLQNLNSKASKYPILKQQINYLIERYC